jgi:GAF domain-containing protein
LGAPWKPPKWILKYQWQKEMNNRLSGLSEQEIKNTAAFNYKGWRERFVLIVLRIASFLGIPLLIFSLPGSTPTDRVLFITIYIILLAVTVLPAPYTIRATLFLLAVYAIGLNSVLAWGPWLDGSIFFFAFVTAAALLFDSGVDAIALIVSLASFASIGVAQQLGAYQIKSIGNINTTTLDWFAYSVDFLVPSLVIVVAVRQFKREFIQIIQQMQSTFNTLVLERGQLEDRIQERTEKLESKTSQLRSSTTVARTVAEMQDISTLIDAVTALSSEQFGYYHVGLYLLDEKKKIAFLQAASSKAGQQMIGQGFSIEPDRRNALNIVVEEKRYYIGTDTSGSIFVRDANFPLTRSRLTMPLSVRGEIIGVLDMHSDQPQAIDVDDAEILQTLADLVAISIDNVRLLDETKALVKQLESYTSLQTLETWSKFTSRHTPSYQYTPAGVRPIFSPGTRKDHENSLVLNIPLQLQGQTIGVIRLKRRGVSAPKWSDRERNLVEKIAEQVALALENSRLVDEAQRNAQRDQLIANISSRVRETLDVESVIRTAAAELRKVFDLKEAEISIGSPQAQPAIAKKHTSSLRLK